MQGYMFHTAKVAVFSAIDDGDDPVVVVDVPCLLYWPFNEVQETKVIDDWLENKVTEYDPRIQPFWRLADRDVDVEDLDNYQHYVCHGRLEGDDDDTVSHIACMEDQDPDDIFIDYVLFERHDPHLVEACAVLEKDRPEQDQGKGFYHFSTTQIPGPPYANVDEAIADFRDRKQLKEGYRVMLAYLKAEAAHKAFLFSKPVESWTGEDHDESERLSRVERDAERAAAAFVKTLE